MIDPFYRNLKTKSWNQLGTRAKYINEDTPLMHQHKENIGATAHHRSSQTIKIIINPNPRVHIKCVKVTPLSNNEWINGKTA